MWSPPVIGPVARRRVLIGRAGRHSPVAARAGIIHPCRKRKPPPCCPNARVSRVRSSLRCRPPSHTTLLLRAGPATPRLLDPSSEPPQHLITAPRSSVHWCTSKSTEQRRRAMLLRCRGAAAAPSRLPLHWSPKPPPPPACHAGAPSSRSPHTGNISNPHRSRRPSTLNAVRIAAESATVRRKCHRLSPPVPILPDEDLPTSLLPGRLTAQRPAARCT
jgi:hypothetical protein